MAGSFKLIGSESRVNASVYTPTDFSHNLPTGLVTYTHNIEAGTPRSWFFTNDDNGADQNINASGAGTLTTVYDGGDTVAFTAAAVSGTWDFASTTQANTGTRSIQLGTKNGDVASLTNASDLNTADYEGIRGYIYITSWPSSGNKNITVQPYLNGAPVGITVRLSVYVDTNVQDSWQLFNIPFTDLAITTSTFDAVWVSMVDSGAGSAPSGFLDDIALVGSGTGGTATYSLKPALDEVYVIDRLKWTAVATSSAIKYDEFFGIAGLTNGYQLSFLDKNSTINSFTASNFFDMLQYPNVRTNLISGTNSIFEVYYEFPTEKQTLVGSREQSINLIVRDDLSSMVRFRASAEGYIRRSL